MITWITLINYGYIDYTKNFLTSMRRLNLSWKLKIYCLDYDLIHAELKDDPNCVLIDGSLFLKNKFSTKLTEWNTIQYKQLCFAKLDCLLYEMEHHQAESNLVGYMDMDIWLFKDPNVYLEELIKNNNNIQMFYSCDEYGECSNKYGCKNMCTGTIVFRNNNKIRGFIKYKPSDIMRYAGDQHYLGPKNNVLKIPALAVAKNILLNGSWQDWCKHDKPLTIPATALLIHANWVIGNIKQQKLAQQGWWCI
jgi:hypothetical protein